MGLAHSPSTHHCIAAAFAVACGATSRLFVSGEPLADRSLFSNLCQVIDFLFLFSSSFFIDLAGTGGAASSLR